MKCIPHWYVPAGTNIPMRSPSINTAKIVFLHISTSLEPTKTPYVGKMFGDDDEVNEEENNWLRIQNSNR
jgi:hypothetical protein